MLLCAVPTEAATVRSPIGGRSASRTRSASASASGGGQPFGHDRVLVAAEAGHRVSRADGSPQPAGDLDQHLIARRMAVGVVDVFEVVDVEVEHGDPAPFPRHRSYRLLQPVGQQRAVGQAGQRIVQARGRPAAPRSRAAR